MDRPDEIVTSIFDAAQADPAVAPVVEELRAAYDRDEWTPATLDLVLERVRGQLSEVPPS